MMGCDSIGNPKSVVLKLFCMQSLKCVLVGDGGVGNYYPYMIDLSDRVDQQLHQGISLDHGFLFLIRVHIVGKTSLLITNSTNVFP